MKSRLKELIEREARRLAGEDLKVLAARFREVYFTLLAGAQPEFIRWLLLQAPIVLTPPELEGSAAAGRDGYIYINPAFWCAVVAWHVERCRGDSAEGQVQAVPDLKALIIHEVAHLLLRHPWSAERLVKEVSSASGQDPQKLQYIANLCMDFVVNAGFLAPLIPEAQLLPLEGVWDRASFRKFLTQALGGGLPSPISQMFSHPDLEHWGWDDLFRYIVKHLPPEDSPGGGSSPDSPGRGEGRDVHGRPLPQGGVVVREGVLAQAQGPSSPSQVWQDISKEAISQARAAGEELGGLTRTLESQFDLRLPWETLLRERLASLLGHGAVRQTWCRPSRKHPLYPGNIRCGGRSLWFLADISGSVGQEELLLIGDIIFSFIKRSGGGQLRLVPWDTEVRGDQILRSRSDMARLPALCGGGGTVIRPALVYVEKRARPGDRLVVCTDSLIADLEKEETRLLLRSLGQRLGGLIWIHFGSEEDLHLVARAAGEYLQPLWIDPRSRVLRKGPVEI